MILRPYRSVNSAGQSCNSTGFLGFYKGVCRLWTRLHCLTDKKNCKSHALQQNIRERARKAKYWFLYRSRNNSKVEVQGEDLIDDTEIPHYHKVCVIAGHCRSIDIGEISMSRANIH